MNVRLKYTAQYLEFIGELFLDVEFFRVVNHIIFHTTYRYF